MSTLIRFLRAHLVYWRIWCPLLLLSLVFAPAGLVLPLLERRLIDDVIVPGRLDRLAGILILYGATWILYVVGGLFAVVLRNYLTEQMTAHLRQRLFDHAAVLSAHLTDSKHSGRTVSLFLNDVPAVGGLVSTTLIGGLVNVIAVIGGLAVMLDLNPELALAAVLVPLMVTAVAWVLTRSLRPSAHRAQEAAAALSERIQEHLGGLREIVAFGQERLQSQRFAATLTALVRQRMRLVYIERGLGAGQSVFSLALTLAILGFGGLLVIEGRTTLGTLVAMQSLIGRVLYPAQELLGLIGGMQRSLASADRIYGFLDQVPSVREPTVPVQLQSADGALTFERVCFEYLPGRTVLQDITFTTRPGELIALVGPSGAGKTTLVSLLARFYDPTHGRILLDGLDIRSIALRQLRSQIGIVFQDTFLFDTSIRENIRFGNGSATDAQVESAARAANAWEFIDELPNGLDNTVGERGVRLSEGQRQRIAIARALLRDPRILILDEPTSALDARSESLLQSALEVLMRGRTTFVIAHRLATVRRADRILVLESGQVIQAGTHDELVRCRGLYRDLFLLQFSTDVTPVDHRMQGHGG